MAELTTVYYSIDRHKLKIYEKDGNKYYSTDINDSIYPIYCNYELFSNYDEAYEACVKDYTEEIKTEFPDIDEEDLDTIINEVASYASLMINDFFESTNKLKNLRKECGYTQSELAKKSNVNVRMIQYYEQGTKDINKAQAVTLYRIAKALDCRIEDLLNLENEK